MVERYRIFAFTTFYRADSMPRPYPATPRVAHNPDAPRRSQTSVSRSTHDRYNSSLLIRVVSSVGRATGF